MTVPKIQTSKKLNALLKTIQDLADDYGCFDELDDLYTKKVDVDNGRFFWGEETWQESVQHGFDLIKLSEKRKKPIFLVRADINGDESAFYHVGTEKEIAAMLNAMLDDINKHVEENEKANAKEETKFWERRVKQLKKDLKAAEAELAEKETK